MGLRKLVWLLMFLALFTMCLVGRHEKSANGVGPSSVDRDFSLQHDGVTRKYRVHLPSAYAEGDKAPVVIYVHGGVGNMRGAYVDGLDNFSDKYGFILVSPEGTGKVILGQVRAMWNGGIWETGECCGNADDVGFISAVIDAVEKDFSVDEKRIYVTGISNGGLMTNRLGCELSGRIAAIAPVASSAIMSDCRPTRPLPVLVIHGSADPFNPPDGSEPTSAIDYAAYGRMTPYQVADAWRRLDECSDSQTPGYSGDNVTCVAYADCAGGAEVEMCIIEGMGHTYPGGSQYLPAELVGSVSHDYSFDQIWEFFRKHPLD